MPVRVRRRSSSARISAWTVTSRAVVGSSATSRSGSPARASAIATRCFCPPRVGAGSSPRVARGRGSPPAGAGPLPPLGRLPSMSSGVRGSPPVAASRRGVRGSARSAAPGRSATPCCRARGRSRRRGHRSFQRRRGRSTPGESRRRAGDRGSRGRSWTCRSRIRRPGPRSRRGRRRGRRNRRRVVPPRRRSSGRGCRVVEWSRESLEWWFTAAVTGRRGLARSGAVLVPGRRRPRGGRRRRTVSGTHSASPP